MLAASGPGECVTLRLHASSPCRPINSSTIAAHSILALHSMRRRRRLQANVERTPLDDVAPRAVAPWARMPVAMAHTPQSPLVPEARAVEPRGCDVSRMAHHVQRANPLLLLRYGFGYGCRRVFAQ